jgi:ATP-binding cassette subfamily B protein
MPRRRLLIPETVQTSAMDCGPAALRSLLEGFGIRASYGRLREACQTDVDGTSIDALEDAARALGLDATQVMIPADHLVLKEADQLPALVVVKLPGGGAHFVVVWSITAGVAQIMDPATGRRWARPIRLQSDLYIHTQPVPADAWCGWAASESFSKPLVRRMRDLGAVDRDLIEEAARDESWRSLAAVDAAVRMAASLVRSGAISRGPEARRVIRALVAKPDSIPETYWSALPGEEGMVRMRGAVLIQVAGRNKEAAAQAPASPELAAALSEKPVNALAALWRAMREEGLLAPAAVALALLAGAGTVVVEALLFRGLLDLAGELNYSGQRLAAAGLLLAFLAGLLLLEFPLAASLLRLGRKLECRLRLRFLEKIPLLGDRYFQSRLVADMAQRAHSVQTLRQSPALAGRFVRALFEMTLTAAGIAWLFPSSAHLAIAAAATAAIIPFLMQPALAERDLRMRNHLGAISRFFLDAMLGLIAVRAHGAERPLRGEMNRRLEDWARSSFELQRCAVAAQAAQLLCGFGLAITLVLSRLPQMDLAGGREAGGILLLVYWALNLPVLGEEIAASAWQYPSLRNALLRFLEPLGAREETVAPARGSGKTCGVSIAMREVRVVAGGHLILDGIDLGIPAGSHVAVVGSSGAGKSSLAGILLGWHRPAQGEVAVDGEPLDCAQLRRETAWVDPQTQLWNRSFLENLRYGAGAESPGLDVGDVLRSARLHGVVEKLPEGMQTPLGEGGALVSGGEGQRVRLGRGLMKGGVRLAILDEPARGLDRDTRRDLIAAARQRWSGTTLLCITHDVIDTADFERVLVIEAGRIVEDGAPSDLASRVDGRYRALLDAERRLRSEMWNGERWRKLRLIRGRLEGQNAGEVA